MSLVSAIENTFKRFPLTEKDIKYYQHQVFSTSQQDVSTLPSYNIEARFAGSEQFVNLSDSYLLVNYTYLTSAGGAIAGNAVTGLTHGAWSLLSNLAIEVNGMKLDGNINPGMSANILYKTSKSYDWIVDNNRSLSYGPAGFSNGIAAVGTLATDATDTNWLKCSTDGSTYPQWVALPLSHVLGSANVPKLLPAVNLVLRADKNIQYNEILMRNNTVADVDYMTKINQIKWYIPVAKVKERLANMVDMEAIKSQPVPIDFQQIQYHKLTGTGTQLQMNLFTGVKRPRFILLAPQLTSVSASQNGTNAGIFTCAGVTEVYVTINGQNYPARPYQGVNEGFLREVRAIKELFGKHKSGDSSSIISPGNFRIYNSIFVFDVSHLDELFEENTSSDVIVQINYTSTEASAQTFHVVCISDKHVKLEYVGGSLQLASSI